MNTEKGKAKKYFSTGNLTMLFTSAVISFKRKKHPVIFFSVSVKINSLFLTENKQGRLRKVELITSRALKRKGKAKRNIQFIFQNIFLDKFIILCYNIHIIRKMFTGSAEKVKSIQFHIQGKAKRNIQFICQNNC